MLKAFFFGMFAVSLTAFSGVQETTPPRQMFGIYADNDSRYLKPNGNTDRHYSSGFRAVYSFASDWNWPKELFGAQSSKSHFAQQATGLFVGHHIYTPNHEDKPERRAAREHTFAGWLYGGAFIQQRQGDTLHYLEWNGGVVGPSAKAKQIQQNTHNMLGSGKTVGWDEQLDDQPASDITYTRLDRVWQNTSQEAPIDLISDIGFTGGCVHRHLEAGLTVRCALNGILANDFGPTRLLLPRSPVWQDAVAPKSIYLFGRLAGRAVEYDRFLTGLTHKPFVGFGSIGLALAWKDFQISYSQTFMTERFKEGDFEDSFGTIELSWNF